MITGSLGDAIAKAFTANDHDASNGVYRAELPT